MTFIQKLSLTALFSLSALGLVTLASSPAYAGHCASDTVEISVAVDDINKDGKVDDADKCVPKGGGSIEQNPIITYLKGIINFLAVGVGIVTVISIVISGIQFMTSQGNPQSISSAKGRLFNAIVALLLFIFMYAILNFLVPGKLIG